LTSANSLLYLARRKRSNRIPPHNRYGRTLVCERRSTPPSSDLKGKTQFHKVRPHNPLINSINNFRLHPMTMVEAPHNLNFPGVGMTIVSVDRLVLDSYLALHNRKLAILKNSLLWEVVAAEKQGRTGAQE
jgi:hypothetical protein